MSVLFTQKGAARRGNQASFDDAIAAHDEAIAARGTPIWVGGEPTFTDRSSEMSCWLGEAVGGEKEERARTLLTPLRDAMFPGGALLRSLGRQYASEEIPRWSYGILARRDEGVVWSGPPDPLELDGESADATAEDASGLRDALARRLRARGLRVTLQEADGAVPLRLAFRDPVDDTSADANGDPNRAADDAADDAAGAAGAGESACESDGESDRTDDAQWERDERLLRASLHGEKTPEDGPHDDLAACGTFLVAFGVHPSDLAGASADSVRVELPALGALARADAFLADLGAAANERGLPSLVIAGFPPPVDDTRAFMTITPDPGVIEVNTAPSPDVASFLAGNRLIYERADAAGLHPERLHYNGQVGDSGGGGHLTLGGPAADASPFFAHPHLVPALVVYFNRHPSLSYLFAVDGVGSSGQSPRPDEGVRESFDELGVALGLFGKVAAPTPDQLWTGLAPFLADRAGNSHRAEINVEKLWNPFLPGRGKLGVIEFRAFRMARTPERAAALAALLRSIVSMLAGLGRSGFDPDGLVDWGPELHDRFALPFHLRRDLRSVLSDLDRSGVGLGQPITAELLRDEDSRIGSVEVDGFRIELRRAIAFWPLVGDSAMQETGTARWVDASTQRLEVVVRHIWGNRDGLAECRLATGETLIPAALCEDDDGPALVFGLRYRSFVPRPGLHPTLPANGPVQIRWWRHERRPAVELTVHDWTPDGGVYDGLPADPTEARRRCAERFSVSTIDDAKTIAALRAAAPPPAAVTKHNIDLRRL